MLSLRSRPSSLLPSLLLAFSGNAWADVSLAKTDADPALTVQLDDGAREVRFTSCATEPCAPSGNAARVAVPAEYALDKASMKAVLLRAGKSVVHVQIPASEHGSGSYELLLAPGRDTPLFAGATQPRALERGGSQRLERHDAGGGALFVLGELPQGGGVCGRAEAPSRVHALDPLRGRWVAATFPRLGTAARSARELTPSPTTAGWPDSRVLRPLHGSDETRGASMVDGEPTTTWSEQRSGDGAGEVATFAIDPALGLTGFRVQLSPPQPLAAYAAPRSFYLATEKQLYRVRVPKGQANGIVEITLPGVEHSPCVSVVLDEADTSVKTPRSVGIAEIAAITSLEREEHGVSALSARIVEGDSPRSHEALAYLLGIPTDLSAAWDHVYPSLSFRQKTMLAEVVDERGCAESSTLAVHDLTDADKLLRERAQARLERCRHQAAPALVAALDAQAPHRERARQAARILALLSPSVARRELPKRLHDESTRAVFWTALGKAFRSASREDLEASFAEASTDSAKLDVLLAAGARAEELGPPAARVVERVVAGPSVDLRYRAAQVAVTLAPRSTEARTAVLKLARDQQPMVRHRTLGLLAHCERCGPELAPLVSEILHGTATDANPRVRAASGELLQARANMGIDAAWTNTMTEGTHDPWPFVRVAYLQALGSLPAKLRPSDVVVERLRDDSVEVRQAALQALHGLAPASVRDAVLDRLDDPREASYVRASAALTLGTLCSYKDADRLTMLAHATLTPMAFELEREVGLRAIEALGILHPADLRERLAPLLDAKTPITLRRAAQRSLERRDTCKTHRGS